ncbi:MAG: type I methionyl aminopeptidase [Actinomycetota bacterium]
MRQIRGSSLCWCGSARKFKRCHGDQRSLRRPALEPGRVTPMRDVPAQIIRPGYVVGERPSVSPSYQILTGPALERMRVAARVAAEVLEEVGRAVAPGITTEHLDAVAHQAYLSRGAYPSTLGYKSFPKSVCTSVNEVICHGIPDDRPLREGDIVNVDITAYIRGMHGDTSATFPVGKVSPAAQSLVEITRRAMLAGVAAVAPGRPLWMIGAAIEPMAHEHGLGVVTEYGGHGIGEVFHAAPHINHVAVERDRTLMEPGMTFTIEPMLTTGSPSARIWDDGWTVSALDGLPSAQFEHTVIVTDTGVEILTLTAAGTSPAGNLDALLSTT